MGSPAPGGTESTASGVRALGPARGLSVGLDAVRDLLARAEAGLPRDRQASDATRRAALGVVCAVAEAVLAADLSAGRPPWTVEVPEDLHDLVERTGLPTRDVRAGLGLLTDAGVLERVVARGGNRLRVAEEAVVAAPVMARVRWDALRGVLRDRNASMAPALAVARAVAARTAGVGPDGAGDSVAFTQQELVATTLFGRTAVVAALRGLDDAGALALAARRGTWTECRLLPPVFAGVGYVTRVGPDTPADARPGPDAGAWPALPDPGAARPPLTEQGWRTSGPGQGRPMVTERGTVGAGPRPEFVPRPLPAPALAVSTGLTIEVAGILVPLQPGMTVEPPPGAHLTVEVDPDGRRYLRIDAAIRVGPLP